MESIYHDKEYYNRSFDAYMEISDRFVLWLAWMDSFFSNKVIKVLKRNVPPSTESLRILGIGCSAGDIDHDLVSRLLTRFSKISNTVLEPTDTIIKYKSLVKVKSIPGVEWNWRQETLGTYYQGIRKSLEVPKFHFISAIAVLYYMPKWEAEIMNMYDLLEVGGVLMITLMSEDSGFWRVSKRFPILADSCNVQINSNQVKTFLRTKKIDFEVVKQTSFVDITCCSKDGDEKGSMIIDFISHVKYFKKTASPQLYSEFMDYFFSTECTRKDKDRLLLNNSIEGVIVTKN